MAVNKEHQLLRINSFWWRVILASSITLAAGVGSFYALIKPGTQPKSKSPEITQTKPQPVKLAVTALGRLQPQGKITYLSAPNSINGVRVEKLFVKEGEEVKAGQLLAHLEDYNRAKSALQQAYDKLQIAKARLAQVKAGAKPGDISAQKATISRLKSQLQGEIAAQKAAINRIQAQVENAQTESDRYKQLYQEGAVSASIADSKALQLKTTQEQLLEAKATLQRTENTLQEQLKEAQARLDSISEVRTEDVDIAQSEVKSAETAIKQAKADFNLTYITSPIDGTVLKVHAKKGEVIATSGFAEIGKISKMYVMAEVYLTDIQKVRVGQKVLITSLAFPGKLHGTVREIGWQIDKQNIFSLNPGADTDRRIVEVKVSIDNPEDNRKVTRLTNLQVDVAIQI